MKLSTPEIIYILQDNHYAPTYLTDESGEIIAALLPGVGFKQKFRAACRHAAKDINTCGAAK